ncbi:MAG: tRNA/rRNA methyltransferase SpoU [Candidatus Kaiserbacteria bacterium]|nr:tRNA/rRNA methyltransferase SpoU [Candidatus Kaiserbacteria bacterium]
MQSTALLLHNIRSAHNVGSLFRTSDGAGISHVYLSGYTPLPIDTLGRVQKEIAKTALGAENNIQWTHTKNVTSRITQLKKEGWHIVGIEQAKNAIDYRLFTPKEKTLFILGNEVLGISASLLQQCDTIVSIPMHGAKESLNVSIAGGIVLFQYAK